MSINRWIDQEDVVHIYNGIFFSHNKEWNNAICNKDEPRDSYAPRLHILSEVRQKKANTIWYHLYVESKKAKLLKKENDGYQGLGVHSEENGEILVIE